jgi:hypothetical protein
LMNCYMSRDYQAAIEAFTTRQKPEFEGQ